MRIKIVDIEGDEFNKSSFKVPLRTLPLAYRGISWDRGPVLVLEYLHTTGKTTGRWMDAHDEFSS